MKYTNHMWRQFRPDRTWQILVNLAFAILLNLHAFHWPDNKVLISILFAWNLTFVAFELIEVHYLGFQSYFAVQYSYSKLSDCWRYVIWIRTIFAFIYLAKKFDDLDSGTWELSMAVLFSIIRLIAFLINSDRSRPYIRMLWIIVIQTIPFLALFVVFIFSITISYSVLKDVEFESAWIQIYFLALGEFHDDLALEENDKERAFITLATLILQILLLSMIVALMGDIATKDADKKVIADIKTRLLLIYNYAQLYKKVAFWAEKADPALKYFHEIADAYIDNNQSD